MESSINKSKTMVIANNKKNWNNKNHKIELNGQLLQEVKSAFLATKDRI